MNAARTEANYFTLDTDPAVWGEKFQERVAKFGEPDDACCVCGKRTAGKKKTVFVLVSLRGRALPLDELPADIEETGQVQGCFPVGSECKKALPARYLISGQQVGGTD